MTWFEVPLARGSHRFRTTHWSLVAQAGTEDEPARRALEELCSQYWPPLYAFARRRGWDPEAALDATQGFFMELLTGTTLDRADQERGRFRGYLKRCFANYLEDQRERASAQKRGGHCTIVSLEGASAEDCAPYEPRNGLTADQEFERRWALTVIASATFRLGEEYAARGRREVFDGLAHYLQGLQGDEAPYRVAAERLGLSEGACRVAVHRMRQRLAELLLEEAGQTLSPGADPREELQHLLAALDPKESPGGA